MRRPVRIPKYNPSPGGDGTADAAAPDPIDLSQLGGDRRGGAGKRRPRRLAPFPSRLAGPLCALADAATRALEYRTARALHAESHGAGGPRAAGQGHEREAVPRLWSAIAARLRAQVERPVGRGYPCVASDLRAAYARFCGPRLWREAQTAVEPLFRGIARGEVNGEQLVDLMDAALTERGSSDEAAGRVRQRLADLMARGCRRTRTRSGGRPATHPAAPSGVGRTQTWVCLDCGEITEQPRSAPLYECGACGERFNGAHSADGPVDGAPPRCPACLRFGAPVADACCPECPGGELEELEMVICPECGAHVVPSDWASHWREHAGARP